MSSIECRSAIVNAIRYSPGADKAWNLKVHISWSQVKRSKDDPILRPNDLLSGSEL